jgi:hypothetical protein
MANPHPTITFRVNLALNKTEKFGPKTNNQDVGILHPDRHTSNIDSTFTALNNAHEDNRGANLGANKADASAIAPSGYVSLPVPGVINTMTLKHDDEFTLYGQQAIECRKKFASGSWNSNSPTGGLGAILEIVE